MEVSDARKVAGDWFANRKIDAIRILRIESGMDLISSKTYLENNAGNGENTLLHRLTEDFCQSKEELLRLAKEELRRLELRIKDLENAIEWEKDPDLTQKLHEYTTADIETRERAWGEYFETEVHNG